MANNNKHKLLEPGKIALIQQTEDGRILQIGLTEHQSDLLQSFLAALSNESPLVQMNEEWELILKKSNRKQAKTKHKTAKPMTDYEFYTAIYHMRSAQKDVDEQRSNFDARAKARMYQNRVDKELEKRMKEY